MPSPRPPAAATSAAVASHRLSPPNFEWGWEVRFTSKESATVVLQDRRSVDDRHLAALKVIIGGEYRHLFVLHEAGNNWRCLPQQGSMDLGIRPDCLVEVASRLIDRRTNSSIERADLAGLGLALHRCCDRA